MSASNSRDIRQDKLRVTRAEALKRYANARLPASFNGRWSRRHWAHASLFASILALLGALVPGFDQALALPKHSQRASLALPLPQIGPKQAKAGPTRKGDSWQVINVRAGETAGDIFEQLQIPQADLALSLIHISEPTRRS